MATFTKIDSIKNLLAFSPATSAVPDFEPLLEILDKIQKQGRFPTLGQVEDSLPISVYRNQQAKYSFKEYIYRAERAKMVSVNRSVDPVIVIALKQPKPKKPVMFDLDLQKYLPATMSMPSMPTLSMQKLSQAILFQIKGKFKQLYQTPNTYKKLEDPSHEFEDVPLMHSDTLTRRNPKHDDFSDFL